MNLAEMIFSYGYVFNDDRCTGNRTMLIQITRTLGNFRYNRMRKSRTPENHSQGAS